MINIEQIAQKFKSCYKIKISFGEKLCRHDSFKIGGEATLFVEAENVDSLCFIMDEIWREKIPYFILGGGTNVVFADEGFEGIVVSTKKINAISILENCENKIDENFKRKNDDASFCAFREAKMRDSRASKNSLASLKDLRQKPEEKIIVCEAGAGTNALVNFACAHGIAGLEEFAGLPGTVGGAVYMNARCFEKEISDVARKISWIEWDGEKCVRREKIFSRENWGYKKSPFTGTQKIVTRVEFALPQSQKNSELEKRAREFVALRKQKGHFEFPCAGSVFKNNRAFGEPSGKIIESLGLKGTQIGGAQIAPFHANIIINTGGAKCSDVRALVELIKREAKSRFGFDLEEEIIFV
ncbi:MAG: UDP-N-acetylmuramate dehydrogenase [Treponemataceae bacterium]|nr:UDP-N-acetylmuramate dehydrogenase [Treponemataceae bacterium]